mgnify:CR=1 FL=1
MGQNNTSNNINMNDILKYHILSYIIDSKTLLAVSKVNKDLNKFIIRNSIIWENISKYEVGKSIKNMGGYRSHKEFYNDKVKDCYLENYCKFYFDKIKKSDELKTKIISTRVKNFNNLYGKLNDELISDLELHDYEFSLKKIQLYEKLIQKGIKIDTINHINYQKINFMKNALLKTYDKDILICALLVCGIIVTSPVSIPVLLIMLYIGLRSCPYGR